MFNAGFMLILTQSKAERLAKSKIRRVKQKLRSLVVKLKKHKPSKTPTASQEPAVFLPVFYLADECDF
jgi:hypothetical protein